MWVFFSAPRMYPTEIHVGSHGSQSVYVTWRGVTTDINEEPIQGYIVSASLIYNKSSYFKRNALTEFKWIRWKQSNEHIGLKNQNLKLPDKN